MGIARYQKLPGGQQLQFAENDAGLIAGALTKSVPAANIRTLTGSGATLAAVKSALGNWLARSAAPDDSVIIFFSGHGVLERKHDEAYLLCYDSDAEDPFSTALSFNELTVALSQRIRAGSALLAVDAVRRDFFPDAGGGDDATKFISALGRIASNRPGLQAMLANGPAQFSREGRAWGGFGVFAKYLAEAFEGKADADGDGIVNDSEVYNFVAGNVRRETADRQSPWRTGASLGRLVAAGPGTSELARTEPRTTGPQVLPTPESGGATRAPGSGQSPEAARTAAIGPQPVTPPATAPAAAEKPATPAPEELPAPASASPRPPVVESVAARSTGDVPSTGPVAVAEPGTAPRPIIVPPTVPSITGSPEEGRASEVGGRVRVAEPSGAPPPTSLQLRAALAAGNLIEPRGSSAWDLYQLLSRDPGSAVEAARFRSELADALSSAARSTLTGDIHTDTITERADDFGRAGQMLSRARSLGGTTAESTLLEKLSAALALLALQFYDEAERALSQLQAADIAPLENARGIAAAGKLEAFRAERAFKRAAELAPSWSAPHYNLGLLYRSQRSPEALGAFTRAVEIDPRNADLQTALGDEHFAREQFEKAAEAYWRAAEIKPLDDALQTKLGHALFSMGRREEADAAYRRANELRRQR